MNRSQRITKWAIDSGRYRVEDGNVYGPRGIRKLENRVLKSGYVLMVVTLCDPDEKGTVGIVVARLVAYKKYGDAMFEKGVQVRHLDGDSTNNFEYNIAIGTASENMMDKPKEERLRLACNASSYLRKRTDSEEEEIRKYHYASKSYKRTMEKFGITSKGSLYYIIHKKVNSL